MRFFFRVEYDGTGFGGWQVQPNAPSIQQELEQAFSTALQTRCAVTGAGRTDAGVHARRQGAHIDLADLPDFRKLQQSVNGLLPSAIAVSEMQQVDDEFHARYSARRRIYKYYICGAKRPLWYNRALVMYYAVDWDMVRKELESLRGEHDFTTFCASGSGAGHCRCTVYEASVEEREGLKIVTLTANRYVYNMVRSIVGTVIDIARGRIPSSLAELLENRSRRDAGTTAPACGLVLDDVQYEGVVS